MLLELLIGKVATPTLAFTVSDECEDKGGPSALIARADAVWPPPAAAELAALVLESVRDRASKRPADFPAVILRLKAMRLLLNGAEAAVAMLCAADGEAACVRACEHIVTLAADAGQRRPLAAAGVVPELVATLRTYASERSVCVAATRALAVTVGRTVDDVRATLATTDSAPVLLNAMRLHMSDTTLCRDASRMLWVWVADSHGLSHEASFIADTVPQLLDVMREHPRDADICNNIGGAVYCMAKRRAGGCITAGVVPAFAAVLCNDIIRDNCPNVGGTLDVLRLYTEGLPKKSS